MLERDQEGQKLRRQKSVVSIPCQSASNACCWSLSRPCYPLLSCRLHAPAVAEGIWAVKNLTCSCAARIPLFVPLYWRLKGVAGVNNLYLRGQALIHSKNTSASQYILLFPLCLPTGGDTIWAEMMKACDCSVGSMYIICNPFCYERTHT